MADLTYTQLKTYADTNINTNNANSITGALHNTMLNYLIQGLAGKEFDSTKPYKDGQTLLYEDATFGWELWVADADVAAGSWSSSNFTRITKRAEKITASSTPYTGIELGTKTYAHNMGHTNFMVQAFESSGANIPLQITAKSNTTITITSAKNYANAVILIIEIVIS